MDYGVMKSKYFDCSWFEQLVSLAPHVLDYCMKEQCCSRMVSGPPRTHCDKSGKCRERERERERDYLYEKEPSATDLIVAKYGRWQPFFDHMCKTPKTCQKGLTIESRVTQLQVFTGFHRKVGITHTYIHNHRYYLKFLRRFTILLHFSVAICCRNTLCFK